MSLLWRDRVGIELSPHRIAWVRKAGGFSANVVAKGVESVTPHGDGPPWRAALDRLKQLMADGAWKNANVSVVLSSHFVRYDCLPQSRNVSRREELAALARHRMEQLHGAAAQAWQLCIGRAEKGGGSPVAAVDGELPQLLKQAAAEAGMDLRSIQPFLMAGFNGFARKMGRGDGWFVTAEQGRFTMARFHEGQWRQLQARSGSGAGALHDWLERENLVRAGGETCREVFLFAPELAPDASVPGYRVQRLELAPCRGYSPLEDRQYSIAMSGLA